VGREKGLRRNRGDDAKDDRRKRLAELSAEVLAESLLALAARHGDAERMVERMLSKPAENIKRFKAKLAGLKRMRRHVAYSEAADFARELGAALEDLRVGCDDPRAGVELVAAFFELDNQVLNHYDDSDGFIGDIYRFDAHELFVRYASDVDDKEWLAQRLIDLLVEDPYGLRGALLEDASKYLPENIMRNLVDRFLRFATEARHDHERRKWMSLVESLALQLKDARLFEKARLASWPDPPPVTAFLDIARAYVEAGDPSTALSWLERIKDGGRGWARDRDELLLAVHGKLGNRDKQAEVAWRIFRTSRSKETLSDLLAVIGKNQREDVIDGEVAVILASDDLSDTDAEFLIDAGRIDEAERYLLKRAQQLDGDRYGSLLPLAQRMEKDGRLLVASIMYRSLLDSILKRAVSKSYYYGVRYLGTLDRLAEQINDWESFPPHAQYKSELLQAHARKSSFWSRYQR
jgi:hypothetical protein